VTDKIYITVILTMEATMNKLILTLEVLNGVSKQEAFNHGIALAQAAFQAANPDLVNPFVGIEVKEERASAAVQVGPLPYAPNSAGYTRIVCENGMSQHI
jgi:hypothetical protein